MGRAGHSVRFSRGGLARWLAPALALHAVVLGLALARGVRPVAVRGPVDDFAGDESELELIAVEGVEGVEKTGGGQEPASASSGATGPAVAAVQQALSEGLAAVSVGPRAAVGGALEQPLPTDGSEPPGGGDAPAPGGVAVGSDAPVGEDASGSAPVVGVGAASGDAAKPKLSMDQLGIGAGNPFLAIAPPVLSADEQARRRLRAALGQGQLDADRQRGLGPEGPVLAAARRLVLANETLVQTGAEMTVRTNAGGRVTSVDVSQVTGQERAWRALAAQLLKALQGVALRVPASNAGVELRLRVLSAVRLPSGADPGLSLDVLGQSLQEGEGPRSASLSLSPKAPLQKHEGLDDKGRHRDMPMIFEVALLELKGDMTDPTSSAQRVVQVSVLSARVHDSP